MNLTLHQIRLKQGLAIVLLLLLNLNIRGQQDLSQTENDLGKDTFNVKITRTGNESSSNISDQISWMIVINEVRNCIREFITQCNLTNIEIQEP